MQAILHNIRSIHNVGSVFRTAGGVGIEKLYLSGYTPAPTDRFGRKRQKFSKVALGAEKTVDWEQVDDIDQLIASQKENNVTIIACEPTEKAVDVRKFSPAANVCLVFGNEPDGLPDHILRAANQTVEIPMAGEKTSLNVSVAFGIITYAIVDK